MVLFIPRTSLTRITYSASHTRPFQSPLQIKLGPLGRADSATLGGTPVPPELGLPGKASAAGLLDTAHPDLRGRDHVLPKGKESGLFTAWN